MGDENVLLEAVQNDGERWSVEISFRGKHYSMTFHPDRVGRLRPTAHELRGPKTPLFHTYKYDLTGLLFRMNAGERFALPFKLRPRWPTPSDPPSLGSS
ncbi:hypothetical protein [Archangium sp.]|uniref:hypothetical protein n=1 Tax=Archangium sp. TaxID=1872627 RepID=UPI00286C840F|nr:hypothetical protein [Archangium sp.]